jgi:hypothetical protein
LNVFLEEMGEDELAMLMGEDEPTVQPAKTVENVPKLQRMESEIDPIDDELLAQQYIIDKVNNLLPTPVKNFSLTTLHRPPGK